MLGLTPAVVFKVEPEKRTGMSLATPKGGFTLPYPSHGQRASPSKSGTEYFNFVCESTQTCMTPMKYQHFPFNEIHGSQAVTQTIYKTNEVLPISKSNLPQLQTLDSRTL